MTTIKYSAYGEHGEIISEGSMEIEREPESDEEVNSMLNEMWDKHIPRSLHDAIAGVNIV